MSFDVGFVFRVTARCEKRRATDDANDDHKDHDAMMVSQRLVICVLVLLVLIHVCFSFQVIQKRNLRPLVLAKPPLRPNLPPTRTHQLAASNGEASKASTSSTMIDLVGSTTSMLVACTFFLVLAWKRDALMVSFFIGAISNGRGRECVS